MIWLVKSSNVFQAFLLDEKKKRWRKNKNKSYVGVVSPMAFVFSLEDALASYPSPARLPTEPPPMPLVRFPLIVFDFVIPRGFGLFPVRLRLEEG